MGRLVRVCRSYGPARGNKKAPRSERLVEDSALVVAGQRVTRPPRGVV